MTISFPSPEFDDVVASICHGTSTEIEMRALNDLLRRSSVARDEYLLRIELHSRLASDPNLYSQYTDVSADCRTPIIQFDNQPKLSSLESQKASTRGKFLRMLALAACLTFVVVGFWGFWVKRSAPRNGTTSTAVAMLTRAVDARWGQGTVPLRPGSALEPGPLQLESGMAQIVFYSGARVVIEGPASLRLVSPKEVICTGGHLLAEVPEPARGFKVRTEDFSVVDLGTEFGVAASLGKSEVHVFRGKVELLPAAAGKQSLSQGQAAVVHGKSPPRLMASSAAAFTQMFDFQKRSLASEAVRYDQWRDWRVQFNRDPSLIVHFDFEEPGGTDWIVPNTAGNNPSVQEATLVGCQRAKGRWSEKQALEFQSVNDRVRLTAPGEWDALTLSTWVCVQGLDRKFNSLFMCDGFKPGTVHWLIRNDGVLGLTVIGSESSKYQIVASPPVLPLSKFGMWLHLAVVLDGGAMKVVHYVNGVQVSEKKLRIAPPFRIGAAELGNWNSSGFPDNDPLLIRNFSGAMDEFCLFNRALSADEIYTLYSEGKPQADH